MNIRQILAPIGWVGVSLYIIALFSEIILLVILH